MHYPLAVRSSSLLEDSQYQPLAGVYETYMLPNNHADHGAVRLDQLIRAVKRVYASTFRTYAKNYFKATPYRLEEEKMAVIIQKVVGAQHGDRFYPDFAGVAPLAQLLPVPPLAAEDGVATVALGLGRTVVDGGARCRSAPAPPASHALLHGAGHARQLAAGLHGPGHCTGGTDDVTEQHYPLEVAESRRDSGPLASTYSPENDAVYDGISRPGHPLGELRPHPQAALVPAPCRPRPSAGVGALGHEHRGGDRVRGATAPCSGGARATSASCRCAPWSCRASCEELDVDERGA